MGEEDKFYKQIFSTPILSTILLTLLPIASKPQRKNRVTKIDTLDPESAREVFHYPAIPTRSLKALWRVQDLVDIWTITFIPLIQAPSQLQ